MREFQQKIQNAYDHLTNTQHTIADFFLEHLDTLPFKRLEELADQIGVSTTSIIRFARSIGYQGYGDMQQDLQQSILGKVSLPERLKSSVQVEKEDHLLLQTFQADVDNIQETLSVLSEAVLAEAVSAIVHARSVYIIGTRGNFSVAHYLGYRLGQIKPGVHLVDGVSLAYPEQVIGIQQEDVCIAFLTPRYSRMTANLVSWIKRKSVKVILFTKAGNSEI